MLAKRALMILVLAVMLVSVVAGFFSLVPGPSACSGMVVAVVVPPGYPEDKLNMLLRLVESNIASHLQGYHVCTMTPSQLGTELRSYPAILVAGNVTGPLAGLAVAEVRGYTLLDYGVAGLLAYYAEAPVVSKVRAELLVVNGDSPVSRVSSVPQQVVEVIAKLAAVNVTGVRIVKKGDVTVNATSYPAVLLRSDTDISTGNSYVISLGGGYYAFVRGIELQLSTMLAGRGAVELPHGFEPPSDAPSWGSGGANVSLVVFDDLACPYCARFYRNVYPKVVEPLVDKGLIRVYALDLPVHAEVESLHRLLWCVYNITGNGTAYKTILMEDYDKLLKTGSPLSVKEVLERVESLLGPEVAEKAKNCSSTMDAQLYSMLVRELARGIGARGVPTVLVTNGSYTLAFYGLPDAETLKRALDWMLSSHRP